MSDLGNNANLQNSIEPFVDPIGNRVGVMRPLSIDEEESNRTENGEDTPQPQHREGA